MTDDAFSRVHTRSKRPSSVWYGGIRYLSAIPWWSVERRNWGEIYILNFGEQLTVNGGYHSPFRATLYYSHTTAPIIMPILSAWSSIEPHHRYRGARVAFMPPPFLPPTARLVACGEADARASGCGWSLRSCGNGDARADGNQLCSMCMCMDMV
eukprot:358340-Chlamydomonas_euryale.AAC.3